MRAGLEAAAVAIVLILLIVVAGLAVAGLIDRIGSYRLIP